MKVFREVGPEWRRGRARWWRAGAAGYTNDLAHAGLFDATGYGSGPGYTAGRCTEVPAAAFLELELANLRAREAVLEAKLAEVRAAELAGAVG